MISSAASAPVQHTVLGWFVAPGLSDHYDDHMTITLTATEAKATILSLLDDVAAGAEVEITKHGRVVARLVPARGAPSLKGLLADVAMSAAGEDDLFSTGLSWDLA
jgi:prevent-host-death family protein